MIKAVLEEINYYKKETLILKSERETLENVLTVKAQDVRKSITNEIQRVDIDLRKNFT
jgi:hypothetical protein